jgi:hypothetical protein
MAQNGLHPLRRHAGGEGDGVLLGYAHVEGSASGTSCEEVQPGARTAWRR